jgi:hypothetical protein
VSSLVFTDTFKVPRQENAQNCSFLTRPAGISFQEAFMNRFRKLGFVNFVNYGENGLQVHSSLLNVVLHD